MGAALIEELARIPADAEAASEFRYRNPIIEPDTLYVAVSQSGETIDTLLAVQEIRRKGGRVVGLVNVVGSAIARECDGGIYLHAGPEVAVASTKALTNMFLGFALLALQLGRVRDLSIADGRRLIAGLARLPEQLEEMLGSGGRDRGSSPQRLAEAESLFFVGRVRGYPVAREGAQKFKEISYRHAEAYQTSELKHGPLALISEQVPTVAIVPDDELTDRNVGCSARDRGPARAAGGRHPRRTVDLGGIDVRADRRTPQRARARPGAARRTPAAAGLPRRAAARPRHRQAAQPRQVGHRRVSDVGRRQRGDPAHRDEEGVVLCAKALPLTGEQRRERRTTSPEVTFADLGLGDKVLKALADVGYEKPSAIQAATIPPLLAGRDVVGLAQTGTGKTAAFALPILSRLDLSQKKPQALVLAPTRELALQVCEAFEKYAAHIKGVHVLPVYGGQAYGVQLSALRRGVHVVVGTPGRIMDHLEKGTLDLTELRFLVLDEADEMLNMGFADDVETILADTPDDKNVALFSATMPAQIRRISKQYLNNPEEITVKNKTSTAPTSPSATSWCPTPRRSTPSRASSRSRTSRA